MLTNKLGWKRNLRVIILNGQERESCTEVSQFHLSGIASIHNSYPFHLSSCGWLKVRGCNFHTPPLLNLILQFKWTFLLLSLRFASDSFSFMNVWICFWNRKYNFWIMDSDIDYFPLTERGKLYHRDFLGFCNWLVWYWKVLNHVHTSLEGPPSSCVYMRHN